MSPLITLPLFALLLQGCSVGPDFNAPKVTVPGAWTGAVHEGTPLPSVTTSEPFSGEKWWESFHDETLNSLIARALAQNLDLKQAESRILQARDELGIAMSNFWPAADASLEYRKSRNSQTGITGSLYQAGFDASWELDLFGGTRRAVEAARADIEAIGEDKNDVLISLIAEITSSYFNLRGVEQELDIARNNLKAQEQSAELVRKLFKGGLSSKLDLLNAEAQVATTRSQIPNLESTERQFLSALSLLLGQSPNALDGELKKSIPLPIIPPQIPVGLPSDLLERRPDLRKALASLHGATARIGVAKSALFPSFALTGTLGVSGGKSDALVKWDNRFYSVGPVINWSIFNAGRVSYAIKANTELEKQALLSYEKTILTALNEVEQALVNYVKEQERHRSLFEAVKANQEAVNLALELYKNGQVDFLNVLSAQRALFSAQEAQVQSERLIMTNLVALYKALGGGWEILSKAD